MGWCMTTPRQACQGGICLFKKGKNYKALQCCQYTLRTLQDKHVRIMVVVMTQYDIILCRHYSLSISMKALQHKHKHKHKHEDTTA